MWGRAISLLNRKMNYCVQNLFGPLTKSNNGMRNFEVCTDAFTKTFEYTRLFVLQTIVVLEVVLEKCVPKYGQVRTILRDQRRQLQIGNGYGPRGSCSA